MTIALAKGTATTVLCFSTFMHVFCSTFRLLSDSYSHGIRMLGRKNLSPTKEVYKRSKEHTNVPCRCDFAAVIFIF